MIDQDHEFLCKEQRVVVIEQLRIESARGRAEEYLMAEEKIVFVQVNADHFCNAFIL